MAVVPTKYWHRLDDGRVQCDVCPRLCKMHEGQRGLCYVRGVEDDKVVLTSYGYASGFCIDPIEKKPLNHFLPGTPILSFGQVGCNLTCRFCQNYDISKARGILGAYKEFKLATEGRNVNIPNTRRPDGPADHASPEAIAAAARDAGCTSVAFTYNDPVIFLEYAVDVAQACHELGIRTVAVTAGYICSPARNGFFANMDAANVDLKCFSDDFYRRLCGGGLSPVLETLEYLKHETDVWFEITNLVIPGENDSEAELNSMTSWIVEKLGPDVPIHFSAFHPDWKMIDKHNTPLDSLRKAREIALGNGIRHAYCGNVHDPLSDATYCHNCHELLIGRDWYELERWNLDADGRCLKCATKCAGVFDKQPGTWGRKRIPIKIGSRLMD